MVFRGISDVLHIHQLMYCIEALLHINHHLCTFLQGQFTPGTQTRSKPHHYKTFPFHIDNQISRFHLRLSVFHLEVSIDNFYRCSFPLDILHYNCR